MISELTKNSEIHSLASIDLPTLYGSLNSSPTGLSIEQYRDNHNKYGKNVLMLEQPEWLVIRFLHILLTPISVLLITLSLVSYLTGESKGAILIALMVCLSSILTFVQEFKSNHAAQKLKALVSLKTRVIRGGIESEVDLDLIVPGDIVRLSVGDLIPADVRIISSKDLFINQSSLTGESLPAEKFHLYSDVPVLSSFDISNLAYMGSHVVSGMGDALVLKTGNSSFFGQLAHETSMQSKQSSFDHGINQFIWLMIRIMALMIPLIFLINGFLKGNWFEAAIFAIAVGVGLAPEMLPMLVTVNLAKGAISLSKKRVIIKRLNAVQNLGAMNILCTDKTGTLTQNEIILEKHIDIFGENSSQVLEYAYLNSHYQTGLSNLLDYAILRHVDVHEKLHYKSTYQKIDEIPFDFERRRLSVVLRKDNQKDLLICKGAVDEIFSCCKFAQAGDRQILLTSKHRTELENIVAGLNDDGFRVIAVAIGEYDKSTGPYSAKEEVDLSLLGYIAFLDPPKESARQAISALNRSGVEIKILTGDNERISRKVCHEVGLLVHRVIIGSEIDELDDVELSVRAKATQIFAKMNPQQKARVIHVLQSQGNVVGYLGDGINDGPGLKVADVSISVDSGVDIAKETADIIFLEKNLLILYEGVTEGRRVFGNIMKYIKMSASSNFGNMFSMIGASALLPFLPMLPVQILLNNMLYDISQTAVPTDSVDPEYLQIPRKWNIEGLSRYIFCLGPVSSIFDYLTFAYLWFILGANSIEMSSAFQTGWFVESLISQTLVIYVIRTSKIPFVDSIPSLSLVFMTLLVCVAGIILPFTIIGQQFHMVSLPNTYWIGILFLLPMYLLSAQLAKAWFIKKWGIL